MTEVSLCSKPGGCCAKYEKLPNGGRKIMTDDGKDVILDADECHVLRQKVFDGEF